MWHNSLWVIKMEQMKGYQSWTLSDEFWDKISWLMPEFQRDPNKERKRKAGGSGKPP